MAGQSDLDTNMKLLTFFSGVRGISTMSVT